MGATTLKTGEYYIKKTTFVDNGDDWDDVF